MGKSKLNYGEIWCNDETNFDNDKGEFNLNKTRITKGIFKKSVARINDGIFYKSDTEKWESVYFLTKTMLG